MKVRIKSVPNSARNASKWHGLGGHLYGGESEDTQQMDVVNSYPMSLQDYIAQRIQDTRDSAVNVMNTREYPRVYYNSSPDYIAKYINDKKASIKEIENNIIKGYESLYRDGVAKKKDSNLYTFYHNYIENERGFLQRYQNDIDSALKHGKAPEGATCIFTVTDSYGNKRAVPGNLSWLAKGKSGRPIYEEKGFQLLKPTDTLIQGDIIQQVEMGIPDHSMMYMGEREQDDSYPGHNGRFVDATYSNGAYDEYAMKRKKPMLYVPGNDNAFRFVGNAADSARWTNEYNELMRNGPLVEYAMGGHLFDNGGQYTVNRGDSLWQIAHDNNMPLSRLRELNPQVKGNMIHPGDVLRLSPEFEKQIVNLREERQKEDMANMDNFTAIQAAPHDSNYVVVDKPNKKLQVYDRDNNLVYESDGVSFGKSGDDYNTITYVNSNGSIRNNAGNNSTPAGISVITGVGTYHGLPSFTRGRINDDGTVENIASSIHYGNTQKKNMSNGCVRASSDTLKELSKYVGEGTAVYTLPEQKGSKFSVKNNKLNYTADNPFGMSEGPQRYWDDYNVRKDKSYSPLAIVYNGNNYDDEYNANVLSYTNALSINKEALQKRFNLSSDEYNRLAELAVGIAEQESKFGTSTRYKLKQQVPDEAIALAKNFKDSDSTSMFYRAGEALSRTINGSTVPARSRGLTQIKIGGDNKEMQGIYKELGINENTINNPYTSALATLSRLAYMYNSEVKGRDFKGAGDTDVSPYDALLYKYMGRGSELKNKTATPDKNKYISNVKKYASDFDFLEERLVEKR